MKDFDWSSFTKRIAVKSTLAEIYSAWTTAANLERWFLERVNFRDAAGKPADPLSPVNKGCSYDWYWFLEPAPMHGRIVAANGIDHLQFTFEGPSLVDVQLSAFEEYVIIELRHHSIPGDDHSRQHIRLGCSNGWAFYLHNLKSVYEGGIDLRNKDLRLGTMINN
ncbi:hypothetical protein C7T94_06390 [Pedobacter yulinensis]|uniref:Activator of Hsp90 ATPase homologue 1/2-like C-terminal domain-containing protein n=1 Tax=Pedobacter yulinensis TaxID=2126353 RepID=A0A2T3HQ74_9SPHI|nr:SRPBCC domain-containing protein [Pedobacter yulinensis]PST84537.1 hypothetical protein C7T94_06390 [Pedobacter yulinensis]